MIKVNLIQNKNYLSFLSSNVTDGYYDGLDCEEIFTHDFFTKGHVSFYWVQRKSLPLEPTDEKVRIDRIIALDASRENFIDWFIFDGSGYQLEAIAPIDIALLAKGSWCQNRYLHDISMTGFDDVNFFKEITECFDDLHEIIKTVCIEKRTDIETCRVLLLPNV